MWIPYSFDETREGWGNAFTIEDNIMDNWWKSVVEL
jgi:hypothetical protein